MADRRPRIFGIGLNKTATTSLHQGLTRLGFNSLHWGGPETRLLVEQALSEGKNLLDNLDPQIDAFSDILALSSNYRLLDEQYPGSRFILTVRPVDVWLQSRQRHVERNIRRKAAGEYDGNFLTADRPAWRAEWEAHVAAVREYFVGRDDFLEIDLTLGRQWAQLCPLLGVAVPDVVFPWENRDAAR